MSKEKNDMTVREVGRLGGLARARNLTPEKRRRIARLGAKKRWAKQKAVPNAA